MANKIGNNIESNSSQDEHLAKGKMMKCNVFRVS